MLSRLSYFCYGAMVCSCVLGFLRSPSVYPLVIIALTVILMIAKEKE